MSAWVNTLEHYHVFSTLYAILLLLVGYFLAWFVSANVTNRLKKRISVHKVMLLRRAIFYVVLILFVISAFQQVGFNVATLLGAAGILTAAIGFASQTSMSNVISGLFIIGEKPFELGDIIRVNDIQGEAVSIDLLSIKIRTSDNTMIRIPNETLIKSAITNLSYYATRRADLILAIATTENFENVKQTLLSLTEKNSFCLTDPKPSVVIQDFTSTGMNILFSVWAKRENFSEMKNTIYAEIQNSFSKNGINLSQPMTLLCSVPQSK